jgi:2-haloacid dehalogenase
MTAERAGRRSITADAVKSLVEALRRLARHPDVPPALTRLRDACFRLTALTNSVPDVAQAQLSNAGLADQFQGIDSVDEVHVLKLAAAPYPMVAQRCGVGIGELCLWRAAYAGNVSAAMTAGAQAAVVGRGGVVPSPMGAQPPVIGVDLGEVADSRLAGYGKRRC